MQRINWWAIAVSAIVFFFIGWIWYGVLFAAAWYAAVGKAQGSAMTGSSLYPHAVALAMAFFLSYGVARVLSWRGDVSIAKGAFIGASLALLFFGTMTAMDYAYEVRPAVLGLINVGYVVVGTGIIGAILAAWRPRATRSR